MATSTTRDTPNKRAYPYQLQIGSSLSSWHSTTRDLADTSRLVLPAGDYSVLILAITHGLDIPDYIIDKLHPDQLRLLEVEAAGSLRRIEQLAVGA